MGYKSDAFLKKSQKQEQVLMKVVENGWQMKTIKERVPY
jgi:hypothetical protein